MVTCSYCEKDYMMGFSMDVLRKENREYLIVVLKNENALQEIDEQFQFCVYLKECRPGRSGRFL